MQTYTTNSGEETQAIAESFAKTLKGGEVLCFYGDLGFGKTTFIQGLARGLGIKQRIISPTFIIMRTYQIAREKQQVNSDKQIHMFYHVDLYRINTEQEVVDLGLPDFMANPENIVAIEWPEKMVNLLPEKRSDIFFEYVDQDARKIKIK